MIQRIDTAPKTVGDYKLAEYFFERAAPARGLADRIVAIADHQHI